MDKLLKYLMFIYIAVAFASCGGDDKDEPDNPFIPSVGGDKEVPDITHEFEDYNVYVYTLPLGLAKAIIGNTGYGDGIFL